MRIIVDRIDGIERVALVDKTGEVLRFYVNQTDRGSFYGGVYLGRVRRFLSSDSGAFIDIGQGEDVWMGSQGIRRERRRRGSFRAGDLVVVQVYTEATENKAARVDVDIRLMGRYVVFLPCGEGVSSSRRCVMDQQMLVELRQRLETLNYGWIIRSHAATAGIEASIKEARWFMTQWRVCRGHLEGEPRQLLAPYSGGVCAIMDAATDIEEILVDHQDQFDILRVWMNDCARDLLSVLRLSEERVSVFDRFGLEETYWSRNLRRVGLCRSGGEIVIERTQACSVIDVNNGTIWDKMTVNLEAVEEIARQLRLRNIQGMIVVDFLRVRRKDRVRVVEKLELCLSKDIMHTEIYGWTRLGLFEMKRTAYGRGV